MTTATRVDVLVIGGGPAGSTSAALLAREGLAVLVCEREKFPRFHIGESLLPYTTPLWRRLGVYEQMKARFQPKWGARFRFEPGEDCTVLDFQRTLDAGSRMAFQVRRADYDQMLLENAASCGARVLEEHEVVEFRRQDGDGRIVGARVRAKHGETFEVEARFVIDATGRDTFLGSRLGLKERDKVLRQVALYGHFRGADMGLGRDGGDILVVGGAYGWFWMIPLDRDTTSVGVVCPSQRMAERGERSLEEFFASLIAESPEVSGRLARAERLTRVEAAADFSYRCRELIGLGWALAGDAACFLDPVFSSGVMLAMRSAERLADTVAPGLLAGRDPSPAELEKYQKFVRRGLDRFRRYIVGFYEPGCASVFRRRPPKFLHSAGMSAFGGKIFERDLRIGAFDMAFFSTAALNRMVGRTVGRLPAAPACDVQQPEVLRQGLPFGKIG